MTEWDIFWKTAGRTDVTKLNRERARCRRCRYHEMDHGLIICGYILHTGKRRPGAPEGADHRCEAFETGERGKTIDALR